jgi:ABC-type bacteriocin/lantibiotic exporter with double-glycine peptidase domain
MAMILRFFGLRVSLSYCREALGAGRDGVNARSMVKLAHTAGLIATAYRLDHPAAVTSLPLPAVVDWRVSHFVVVTRANADGLRIIDPAVGRRSVPADQVPTLLGEHALCFVPGPAGPSMPAADTASPSIIRSTLRATSGSVRRMGALLLAASLVLQAIGLVLPIGVAALFDYVLPTRESGLLPVLMLAAVGLILAQFILGHLRSGLLVGFQADVDQQLMTRLFGHLLSLPFRFFATRSSSDLLQRLSSSILLRELISAQLLAALIDGLFVLVYLILLTLRDPTFAVIAAAIGIIEVGAALAVQRRLMSLRHQHLTVQAEAEGLLIEALTGIATVKAMGVEDKVYGSWLTRYRHALTVDCQQSRLAALADNVGATVRVGAPLLLLIVGTWRMFSGSLTLGEMMAAQTLAMSMLIPLTSLVSSTQVLLSITSHVQRLQDVFSAEPEVRSGESRVPITLDGRIELNQVSFRYDDHGPWVLRDLELTIEPGQRVALVGASGGGKSTLALLLLGLLPPTTGEIRIAGRSLAELEPTSVRRQIGIVMQDSFIFRDSIRHNIALNAPDSDLQEIEAAAAIAALDRDIAAMPMGYDTMVSERGTALSGGQRQRLALARAVLTRPRVLILDEATSHLDAATEQQVAGAIATLQCTQIIVAHRLSTVRTADLIVVLHEGQIAERGSHADLLAAGGRYADLVLAQLGNTDRLVADESRTCLDDTRAGVTV